MKRMIWVITAAAIVLSLSVTAVDFGAARRTRAEAAELTRRSEKLEAEIRQARQQLADRMREGEDLGAALRQAVAQKEKPSPGLASIAESIPPRRPVGELMQVDPAINALVKQSLRAELMLYGGRFYAKARLSPAQIERLQDLKLDAELGKIDLYATAKSQGLADNDPALARMRKEAQERLESAEKELLGDAAFAELKRSESQQPLTNFVMQVARLAPIEEPLTPAQCDQLIDALSNASSQFQKGGAPELSTMDPTVVLQQAAQILTPVQFAALRTIANHIELQQLNRQFFRQKKQARSSSP